MMLKRNSSQSKRGAWTLLRAGIAGVGVMAGGAAVTAGCLDRPVTPATPKTSNVYVDEIRQTAVDKIDLLFMIDNSISMADKQKLLAKAVPELVGRLITPICVQPCTDDGCSEVERRDGRPTGANSVNGDCPGGGSPEFQPIRDIHVGIVSSSLGSHGGAAGGVCTDEAGNDHARLIGQIRPNLVPVASTWNSTGFLKWDQGTKYTPPGDNDGDAFINKFTSMVTATGELGCGFEASLESWYRFLIDPEPPLNVVVPPQPDGTPGQFAVTEGIDEAVLAQRAAFLREDSLVAVIMLSDENDCSIQDEGYGWLLSRQGDGEQMLKGTSECAMDPNSECCQSCAETEGRGSCGLPKDDPACQAGTFLPADQDAVNLRCWDQKKRFGIDLLYPISRYVEGLRAPTLLKRSSGERVTNPLFATAEGSKNPPRERGLVFLAGIVGVPWQDIADQASLNGPGLRYKTAAQLLADDTWKVILGDPTASPPVPPTDPFMIETTQERSGTNPITGDAIVPATSMDPQANKINGHEQVNVANDDLQYACTFRLEEPLDCTEEVEMSGRGCDCFALELADGYNRPLCHPVDGGPPTTRQTYAKAYPGLRHLQALKDFGNNSIVASICPKYPSEMDNPDYGYNPAVKSIIDRLKEALKGKCLPRPLLPKEADDPRVDGLQPNQVPCKVVEATLPAAGAACACDPNERRADITNPALRTAILTKLRQNKTCDTGDLACEEFCTCELLQLEGEDLRSCQNDSSPRDVPGYCYINATANEPNVGNPELVKSCSADQKRLLRFVGSEGLKKGAIALVACLGASLGTTAE